MVENLALGFIRFISVTKSCAWEGLSHIKGLGRTTVRHMLPTLSQQCDDGPDSYWVEKVSMCV